MLIIGIIVGAAAAFLVAKYKFDGNKGIPQEQVDELGRQIAELSKNKEIAEGKIIQLTEQVTEWKGRTEAALEKNLTLNKQLATKEEAYKNIEEKLSKQKEEIEHIQTKFSTEFKNLANEIL